MNKQAKIKSFENYIFNANKIILTSHARPDGDAVGSCLGLYHLLLAEGKQVNIILPDSLPDYFSYLHIDNLITFYQENPVESLKLIKNADLMICCDFNNLDRAGDLGPALKESKIPKILIDHHLDSKDEEFDLVFSAKVSSTCEIIFDILLDTKYINNDINRLPYNTAEALSIGLITDTNNFNNSCETRTYEVASLLSKRGINLEEIHTQVYGNYSLNQFLLRTELLKNHLVINPKLHLAYMILTKDLQNKYHHKSGDSEGLVNIPLKITDIQVSIIFTEKEDKFSVSLRSKDGFSVNDLAKKYFNGGGHIKAAGGKIFLKANALGKYLTDSFEEFIK
ncbi:MAG: bifunctional oligoribonuclease/PAP phosphatase NrnA [Bacteroidales bacterium]